MDKLVAQGKVQEDGHRLLANSKIGVAVKSGATKPDVSTVDALKQTLVNAKSIAYSDSASGEFLSKVLFPRLGLSEQLKGKSRMIPAEPVAQVVARGDADLGFQQVSELLPVQGIDLVGELPDEAQQVTPFSAGVVVGSKEQAVAKSLIDFLASKDAAPVIRKTGLTPAIADSH